MKQILLLLIGLLFFQTTAEAQLLSEKAQISLLTSSPMKEKFSPSMAMQPFA